MKTIKIAESIKEITPKEFLTLPNNTTYRLTKLKSTRDGFVNEGDSVVGPLCIVDVLGNPGVKVLNNSCRSYDLHYIRTSPIVCVMSNTNDVIVFETEGGIYELKKEDK